MDPRKVEKRVQSYENEDIIVTFDPNVCKHTGICLRGLGRVFNIKERRWIQLEHAAAADIAAQVGRCPSGALKSRMKEKPK